MPRRLSVSDVRGGVRLLTDTTLGVTDVVEAMHATIARPMGRQTRTRGLTGWIYRIVRGTMRRVGRLIDFGLATADRGQPRTDSPAREAVVAALNGAFGDRMAAEGNPLATSMHVRHEGKELDLHALATPRSTLLLQIHGICMHDAQWGTPDHDPGAIWADAIGATRLMLRYNSGRHISENGRELAHQLESLLAAWPFPVERLVVVGHSMGGLVARSAFSYLEQWPANTSLVTLGSPHHGAPLERLGNLVDVSLSATRYTGPLAALGHARSAGVTDLRFGSLRDEDWADRSRFARDGDARQLVRLPLGVKVYAVAATLAGGDGGVRDQTIGDGLVPLDSALGRHPTRDLGILPARQWVATGRSHFDLLHQPEVTEKVLEWLIAGS
ncbi:MAG: permease [Rubricoccaceae bacterium]